MSDKEKAIWQHANSLSREIVERIAYAQRDMNISNLSPSDQRKVIEAALSTAKVTVARA